MGVGRKKSRGNNAKRIWKRSVSLDAARFDVHNSTSHDGAEAAIYYTCAEIDETIADHVIPRKSITSKQRLDRNVHPTEGIVLHGAIPEKVDGEFTGKTIQTNDLDKIRYTEFSPKTLLKQGIPFKQVTLDRESNLVSGLDRRKIKQFNIDLQLDKSTVWVNSNNPYCQHERIKLNTCLDCYGTLTDDPKSSSIPAPKLIKHLE